MNQLTPQRFQEIRSAIIAASRIPEGPDQEAALLALGARYGRADVLAVAAEMEALDATARRFKKGR